MSHADFLNDKFTLPALPDVCAPRTALLRAFSRAAQSRLVYVSAEAGFGKTTTALLWLKQTNRKTVWIDLDEYDNMPYMFYKQLCIGILSFQPNNEKLKEILKNPAFSASPIEQTINFISELEPTDEQFALVLDNMHCINHEEILKSLPFVLVRFPYSFVKIIITRNEPTTEYKKLAENAKASIITSARLEFTEDEILSYFEKLGFNLRQNEVGMALAFTGGKASSVINLVKGNQFKFEHSQNLNLEDYISEHIWDKWDDGLKDFLLKTAILDYGIPVELCTLLTERKDSRNILEKLHNENYFVSKLNTNYYRYHPIFLKFLKDRQNVKNMRHLYKIASSFYFTGNEPVAARRYAIKSEDYEAILKTSQPFLQQPIYWLGSYIQYYTISHQNFAPEHICKEYPYFYMQHIWINYLCGDAPKTEYFFDKLYENLLIIEEKYPQFLDAVDAFKLLDYRTACADISANPGNLKTFKYFYTYATLQLPFLHRRNRDCLDLMKEAAESPHKTDIFSMGLRCAFLYETNKLDEALQVALAIPSTIDDATSDEFMFSGLMHLAATYFAAKNNKRHTETLQQIEKYIEKNNLEYMRSNFFAYKTKALLLDGNHAEAQTWLKHGFVAEPQNLSLFRVFQHFTTIRAHIALSQTDKAAGYIAKLKKLATDFHRPMDLAETQVLQAVLEWTMGKKKEAQATLESVLESMQPFGFVRIIADEGAAILPVLKKIVSKVESADYSGKLNTNYVNIVYLASYTTAQHRKGYTANAGIIKLSKQQKNMLTLLAQGYRNAEIVAKTGLSINTVKSHIRIAYEKLNVNNMKDAVIKARELGIIE